MRSDPDQPGDVNVDAVPQRATVTVRLADGAERAHTIREPRGHPRVPLGRDALHAKFVDCAARALPAAAHHAAFEALDGIAGAGDLGAIGNHLERTMAEAETATTEAAENARAFTQGTTVFDCLGLFYVLDEPYATRCLEAGVNVCNVTFALESTWDQTMSAVDEGFAKIEASPVLALARNRAEIDAALAAGWLAVVPGTQGSSMIGKELARVGILARLGFRFFGLAYTGATLFADGCGREAGCGAELPRRGADRGGERDADDSRPLPHRPPLAGGGGAARPCAGLHPLQRLAPRRQRPQHQGRDGARDSSPRAA